MYQSPLEWYYCTIPMTNIQTVLDWFLAHPRLSALVAGVGLGSAFVWPLCTPLALLALLLCVFLLERLEQSSLPLVLTIVFGCKALLSLSWFLSAYPITWLFELSLATQLLVVFIYWGICAVFLSSAGIVLALLWRLCRRFAYRIYLLPVLWVLAEYLGAVIFSIFSAGPGSYITGAFSFGHIGYLFSWLTPLALFGGAYGIGLIGVFIAVSVYQYLTKRQRKIFVCSLVLIGGLFMLAHETIVLQEPESRFILINTNFDSQVATAERAVALNQMVEAALAQGGDYVLLPEDARYLYQYQLPEVGPQDAIEAWRIMHATNTAIVIDSGRMTDERTGAIVQRAFVWRNDDAEIYTADKQYLVPQGEFMPSLAVFALRFVGFGAVADVLSDTINYTSSRRVVAADAGEEIPNILFCFESVSPLAAKSLVKHRPSDFIMHPMSHSWFHDPVVVWRQLDTMLRFQAVYAKTPIVSVGNEIRGKIYLTNGQIAEPTTIATFPYGTIEVVEMTPQR